MKKLLIFLCHVFFNVLALTAQEPPQGPQVFSDGYLALFLEARFLYRENSPPKDNIAKLGGVLLGVSGSSPWGEVYTELILFDNMAFAARQYANKPNYLPSLGIDAFSFTRLLIEYDLFYKNFFHFYLGLEPGHRGYLSPEFKKPLYQIYLAGTAAIKLVVGSSWASSTRFTLPLAFLPLVYAHNAESIQEFRIQQEITFSPQGRILNPLPPTVFFSLGARYAFTTLETYAYGLRKLLSAEVFFRIAFLY